MTPVEVSKAWTTGRVMSMSLATGVKAYVWLFPVCLM